MWEVYENAMLQGFNIQNRFKIRLISNMYSRLFITYGSFTPSSKSSANGFCWKQDIRLNVYQLNNSYTYTTQNFCCESYSAVITFFNYTEITNRFQQACAEMHFDRPNSGFLICTVFTLVIAGNFLEKKKNEVMQTFTFL